MKDFKVDLPDVPENLTVKSFMWSADGGCTPLDNVSELSNIPDNAIECYGRAVGTYRTDPALEDDEIRFSVEKSDDSNIEEGDSCIVKNIKTDIAEHLFEYVRAYILYNYSTDEYEIIDYKIETSGNPTVVKNVPLSEVNITEDMRYINGYRISDQCEFIVNESWCNFDYYTLMNIIETNQRPDVMLKLLDTDLDRRYDYVLVDYYAKATVDSVVRDGDLTTVYFWDSSINEPRLRIDEMDEDVVTEVYDKNGMMLGVSGLHELEEGDMIYIAYDINDYDWSIFYEILTDKEFEIPEETETEFTFTSAKSSLYSHIINGKNYITGDLLIEYSGKGQENTVIIDFYNDSELVKTEEINLPANVNYVHFNESYSGRVQADSAELRIEGNGEIYYTDDIPVTDADDVYTIRGRVLGTYKHYNIEPGYAMVSVENNRWEERREVFRVIPDIECLYEYAEMLVADGTILRITPYVEKAKVSFMTSDLYYKDLMTGNSSLGIWDPVRNRSIFYRLDINNLGFYVNGIEVPYDESSYRKYLSNNPNMKITLLDVTAQSSTSIDGRFDYIFVDYYCTAVVDSVTETDDGVNIAFKAASEPIMEINIPSRQINEEYVSIYKDGKAISYTDIKPGDVLSIAYDVGAGLEYSLFKEITVSSNTKTITGMLKSYDDWEKTIIIDDVEYAYAGDLSELDGKLSEIFTLYFDDFGRVAYLEEAFIPDDNEIEEDFLG